MVWISYRYRWGLLRAVSGGLVVVLSVLGIGCSATPSEPVSLIDHGAWTANLAAEDDPFDDRPEEVDCSALSYGPETTGGEENLEVDTTRCDYLTVSQPSLAAVRVGDSLHLRLWHFDLAAEEPATAHVAIGTADELLWETTIQIPQDATLLNPTWQAESRIGEGDSLYFHLHNHGQNTWNFIELTVSGG